MDVPKGPWRYTPAVPSDSRKPPPDPNATVLGANPDPPAPVDLDATFIGARPPSAMDSTVLNVKALPAEGPVPAAPESRASRGGPVPRAPEARPSRSGPVPRAPESRASRATPAAGFPASKDKKPRRRLRTFLVDGFIAVALATTVVIVIVGAAKKHQADASRRRPVARASPTPLPPPASEEDQAKSRAMMTKGDQAVAAKKLADARWYYTQAVTLDRRCEPCGSRLRHVEADMLVQIRASLAAGIKDIDAQQYEQAIRELEKVQELAKDPTSPRYRDAAKYLEIARKKRAGG